MLDELLCPAAGIGADQQPLAPGVAVRVIRQRRQGCIKDVKVIGYRVGPGFAGSSGSGVRNRR